MFTIRRLAWCGIGIIALQAHADPLALTGSFTGSGRACYGKLEIKEKTISWDTTFSRCRPRAFRLADDERLGGKLRRTFAFIDTAPSCRFQVVSLTHKDSGGADAGWEATGYADLASYEADKRSAYTSNTPDMMSCALIRDPGQADTRRKR